MADFSGFALSCRKEPVTRNRAANRETRLFFIIQEIHSDLLSTRKCDILWTLGEANCEHRGKIEPGVNVHLLQITIHGRGMA